jgi:putative alpha-1,2-mannosidase
MTKRLITGTANERGRRIFVQPADGSMKLVSYGRIRLDKIEPEIRFSNDGQETGLICLSGTCVVDVGGESFAMKRDDALHIPKGSTMAIRTELEVKSLDVYSDENFLPDGQAKPKGKSLRSVLKFKTHVDEVVHVKTGISGVDVAGASKNLAAEVPGWDFDGARKAAHAAWRSEIGRIRVSSDDRKYLEIFYTGLYHMMVAPNIFDDVDGRYRGMDGNVHTLQGSP